jgi:hypothetical protein
VVVEISNVSREVNEGTVLGFVKGVNTDCLILKRVGV